MSDASARQRLDTPKSARSFAPRFDVEAVGRVSERIARFLGTGRYLAMQTLLVIVWVLLNLGAFAWQWDPYPFILLNLAFSTQAAYAAPLILLAQTRQAERDKVQAEADAQHREQLAQHHAELLEANTRLTEQVERLTREIHARVVSG